jgi:hypothetical protein
VERRRARGMVEMASGMRSEARSQTRGAVVSFFFLFKKTTLAEGDWIGIDRRVFWASRPASGAVRVGRTP